MIISKRQHACRLLIILYRGRFDSFLVGLKLHTLKGHEGFETASNNI
jgi:hypothetical protein